MMKYKITSSGGVLAAQARKRKRWSTLKTLILSSMETKRSLKRRVQTVRKETSIARLITWPTTS
jgi:hypothetical protein